MKAIVYAQYGSPDVLQLQEVEKPQPKENEVLIKVHATSVNFGDTLARNYKAISPSQFNMAFPIWLMAKLSFGLNQPKITILGNEFAGEIEAIGGDVTNFRPGDQVFGYVGEKMGAYAEYLCIPANGVLASKPANLTFKEAAVVPYGALMALPLLRKLKTSFPSSYIVRDASISFREL